MLGSSPKVKELQQVAEREAGRAAAAGQADRRQLRQLGLADQVVRLQHAEFGGDDVGPARQQVERQAGGHRRQLHAFLQPAGRDLEVAGRHAEQGGQRVLGQVAEAAQLQQVLGQAG